MRTWLTDSCKNWITLITSQSSEFLDKVYMTFVHMKPCAGVIKRTQSTILKTHIIPGCIYTKEQDYAAAVATCNSDTCIVSPVNHWFKKNQWKKKTHNGHVHVFSLHMCTKKMQLTSGIFHGIPP